ncbi:MAG: AhpC/TSA family protein [Candidatus Acidiferrum sp.]
MAQLREHEKEFRDKGAALAAIELGDRNYARMFREETGIPFPLLIDENREAYRVAELRSANLLHLLRWDNAEARKRARAIAKSSWDRIRFSLAEVLFSVLGMSTALRISAKRLATMLLPRHCWRRLVKLNARESCGFAIGGRSMSFTNPTKKNSTCRENHPRVGHRILIGL